MIRYKNIESPLIQLYYRPAIEREYNLYCCGKKIVKVRLIILILLLYLYKPQRVPINDYIEKLKIDLYDAIRILNDIYALYSLLNNLETQNVHETVQL